MEPTFFSWHIFCAPEIKEIMGISREYNHTVDGRNAAPVGRWCIQLYDIYYYTVVHSYE
jgi:uncharacterized LabA/DUF88 family protein